MQTGEQAENPISLPTKTEEQIISEPGDLKE